MNQFGQIYQVFINPVANSFLITSRSPFKLRLCLLVSLAVFASATACVAQVPINKLDSHEELPNAPGYGPTVPPPLQLPSHAASAVLSGSVTDLSGSMVPDARLTLTDSVFSIRRMAQADSLGRFTFSELPPGTYCVTIEADGLQKFVSDPIPLNADTSLELPAFALRIAAISTDVEVFASPDQVAQAQVKLAEQQRVLGIVPNFYSSYIWDAAPLTTRLKFDLAFRSTIDPVAFLLAGGVAGVEQAHNTFPGYGSGPEGYAKRYGAAYADNVIGRMVGSAILPSLLHQDPRYFYKGKGSVRSRALYAIGATFIARSDNGRLQPNYSHILGNFAAAGLSNLYRTDGDRSATLTIRNGFIITGTNAVGNLVREFLLKGHTSKVPEFAQGQP